MWDSNASLFGMEALESMRDGVMAIVYRQYAQSSWWGTKSYKEGSEEQCSWGLKNGRRGSNWIVRT
jgi:hypothetical protein